MEKLSTDSLLREIEELRNQLHLKVWKNNVNHQELMSADLIEISKKLDELIVKYMTLKKT